MTDNKRYQELASKWLDGSINEAEKAEFAAWYRAHQDDELPIPSSFATDEDMLKRRILAKIQQTLGEESRFKRFGWRISPMWIAASALLVTTIVVYWMLSPGLREDGQMQVVMQDVAPGEDRATLTLADGRIIVLDSTSLGQIAEESGIKISRTAEGYLLYEAGLSSDAAAEAETNTIVTPRGGQYQVALPDGTHVWLNSGSSLRYPVKFANHVREVTLETGEAYFDVKLQMVGTKRVPFVVKTAGQEIEVLGTQFNVNAYHDENGITTTLVTGAVRISHDGATGRHMLQPGQQLHLDQNKHVGIKEVDTEEFTAWKDGLFYFNEADIYAVMRQLGRWYDVQVRYDIQSAEDLYIGKIPRNVSLSTALKVLKTAGVNFELVDGTVVVKPR